MSFRIQIDDWANKYRPFVCSNAKYFTRCLCFFFNLTFLMAICCYGILDFDYYLRVSLSFLPFEWCLLPSMMTFVTNCAVGNLSLERAVQVNSRILWNIMEWSELIFDRCGIDKSQFESHHQPKTQNCHPTNDRESKMCVVW